MILPHPRRPMADSGKRGENSSPGPPTMILPLPLFSFFPLETPPPPPSRYASVAGLCRANRLLTVIRAIAFLVQISANYFSLSFQGSERWSRGYHRCDTRRLLQWLFAHEGQVGYCFTVKMIGHFRVALSLITKARLSAKFFLWKFVLFPYEWNSVL